MDPGPADFPAARQTITGRAARRHHHPLATVTDVITMNGTVYKHCGCTRIVPGPNGVPARRQWGTSCPKLRRADGRWNPRHGTWGCQRQLPTAPGERRATLQSFGHPTRDAAEAALDRVNELLDLAPRADHPGTALATIAGLIRDAIKARRPLPDPDEVRARLTAGQPIDTVLLVAQYLREWIEGKNDLKPNTRRSYRQQIEQYLIPALGHHRLDRLRAAHLQAALDQIAQDAAVIAAENTARRAVADAAKRAWHAWDRAAAQAARTKLAEMPPFRSPAGPATIQRIRACLRSALTDAAKQQLVTVNVAKLVNLPTARRPKPKIWTPARVAAWRKTGEIPNTVMVWTAPQTTSFLARAKTHPLHPLYLLVAHCGLRRGEAVGLPWADLDFSTGEIQISQQIIQLGWATDTDTTKSEAGDRTVIAPLVVLKALAVHRKKQTAAQLAHGPGYLDTGLVFTDEHGGPLHPDHVLEQFQRLAREADLPPIRLHDLRHGAATLALAAGVPMKTVSEMLGHASITITADTYTVVDEARRAAADAIADQLAG